MRPHHHCTEGLERAGWGEFLYDTLSMKNRRGPRAEPSLRGCGEKESAKEGRSLPPVRGGRGPGECGGVEVERRNCF